MTQPDPCATGSITGLRSEVARRLRAGDDRLELELGLACAEGGRLVHPASMSDAGISTGPNETGGKRGSVVDAVKCISVRQVGPFHDCCVTAAGAVIVILGIS